MAKSRAMTNKLSPRHLEILEWSSQGKTNAEIGLILSLSELTVKNHMSSIIKKNELAAIARMQSPQPFATN